MPIARSGRCSIHTVPAVSAPVARFSGFAMSQHRIKHDFPLHIHITTLFVLLIISFGCLISYLQYRDSSRLILKASAALFDRVADETLWSFRAAHQEVGALVELLALSPLSRAETLDQRLRALRQLTLVLSHNRQIAGLQIGYKDGDYFIVRKLEDAALRATFEAPPGSAFMLDHIETDSGRAQQVRLFFSATLAPLETRELGTVSYDPRQRPWFEQALGQTDTVTTDPYLFYFMRQLGVTLARDTPDAVVSADMTLSELDHALAEVDLPPSAELLLISARGTVLAHRGQGASSETLVQFDQLEVPVLQALGSGWQQPGELQLQAAGQAWLGRIKSLRLNDQVGARLVMLVPRRDLLADAYAQQWRNLLVTLGLLAAMVPLTWYLANRIAAPLRALAVEAQRIQRFDFAARVLPETQVVEIAQLQQAIVQMKQTINQFLQLTHALAGEPDLEKLKHQVVAQTRQVSGADAALLWLLDEEAGELFAASVSIEGVPHDQVELPERMDAQRSLQQLEDDRHFVLEAAAAPDYHALFGVLECTALEVERLPLYNRAGEPLGVLYLLAREAVGTAGSAAAELRQSFVRELSGFAAISIESGQLLAAQKMLLASFIRLLASAIDAKSPYTGGHCQRVPELSKMIAQAACTSEQPAFADYALDEQGWEALHIASWLHDCGKVTTPEYVVDKATKLETLYDRIHEVRMRFEVLKRDAELAYWQARAEHPQAAAAALRQQLDEELAALDDDFAFIAECNLGGEFMAEARIARLQQIAGRTWQRTLDDRLGISHEELARRGDEAPVRLPVTESLLADKPWHRIGHDSRSRIDPNNPWGFKLEVPRDQYNRGELYNLSVARGTLTEEERYRINDHIVQTIIMLEQLPFPKHLRQVPEIAGGHHERIDGTGYPRRLTGAQMSLTARMIAIADVFEALTASDRPYKPAKKLSEALRIMQFMCQDGHLDKALFHLFLERGIAEQYAERFLAPEQIDPINPEAYRVGV